MNNDLPTTYYQGTDPITPQAPQTPASKGNFFTRLLPAAGGILGGIAGGAADIASLGALAPLINPITGAAAGGALGQEAENVTTGTKGNILAAGAENAVGQGVGGILGKGVSALAGKVFAPLAQKGATQLVAGQAKGLVPKDLAQFLTDHGFTDLNKAGDMSHVLTGGVAGANENVDGTAILNKFVEDNLANNGPAKIDITDMTMPKQGAKNMKLGEIVAGTNGNKLQQAITDNSLGGTPQADAIRSKISGITEGIPTDIEGNTDAIHALNFQRQTANLGSEQFQKYIDSGRSDSTALNMFNTYKDLSDGLKSKLGLDQLKVAPEDQTALAADVQKFGSNVNPKAAQMLSDQISNTKDLSLGDVRGLEQNWVTVNRALQKVADQANKNFGSSTSDIARSTLPIAGAVTGMGGKKSLLGAAAGLATSNPNLDSKAAGVLDAAARGAQGKTIQNILPRLIQATSVAGANIPNIAESGANNVQSNSAIPQGASMSTSALQTGGQAGSNPIADLFNQLLAQEQAGAGLTPNSGSLVSELGTLAPTVQKQQLLAPGIQNTLNTFANAGGAQGAGGGLLSRITGLIPGTPANTYNNASTAAAAQLAQLLGITPQAAQAMLPQLMQNQQTAAPQVGGLQSILGGIGASPSAIPAQ